MDIRTELIKMIREDTGCGVLLAKRAIDKAYLYIKNYRMATPMIYAPLEPKYVWGVYDVDCGLVSLWFEKSQAIKEVEMEYFEEDDELNEITYEDEERVTWGRIPLCPEVVRLEMLKTDGCLL